MGRNTGIPPHSQTLVTELLGPALRWGGFFVVNAASPRVREFLARANHARKQARVSRDPDARLFWYTMEAQWLKRAEIYDLPDPPDNVVEFSRERIAWARARSASQAPLT